MAFKPASAQRPDWPEAYLNAGIAYARCGNPEDARRAFQEALVIQPESTDAARGLAALALEQQKLSGDEALDLHRQLISMGAQSAEVFYNAGLLCQKRGHFEDAATYYRQAIEENASFAEALLNLGHVLRAQQKEDEAQSCWRRALREKPELAQTYFEPRA